MKLPSPGHPITIAPNPKRVRVVFNGRVVVDTTRALTLKEATLRPVQYVPREDADMTVFERTAHASHCPFKGDAAYFSLKVDGRTAENAVWTYETPYPAVAEIEGPPRLLSGSRRRDRGGRRRSGAPSGRPPSRRHCGRPSFRRVPRPWPLRAPARGPAGAVRPIGWRRGRRGIAPRGRPCAAR